MGWCQAIVLVAYFGILQCDLSQTAKCNCNNKPTIMQFRIPTLDTQLNYPCHFPLPYPYINADKKPSDNQRKCGKPKCNTRLQPAAVKISIPTATKSGWTNIIIDTRKNPNGTFEYYRPKPQRTNVNVFVQVGNSNKTLSKNATEPAVSAKTNVSSTKDANGNHVTSVSSADDSKSSVSVTVNLNQLGDDNLGDSEDDFIVNSDSFAKDDKGNVAKSTSTTGIDEKDKIKAKPDSKPKSKVDPKPTTKNPDAKNPKAKELEAKKPEAEKPDAKKPVAEELDAKKPEAEKPEAKELEAEEPEAMIPEAEKPEADEPVAEEAEGEKPVAKEAEAEKPEVPAADGAELETP